MVRTSMFDGLSVAERPARFDITSFDFEHAVEDESGLFAGFTKKAVRA